MWATLRRKQRSDREPTVSSMELFFDLVYVFAITQLSHHLLTNLTLRGAVETGMLFLAVWWAWNYTAWATNWIDPDQPIVRGVMVVLMLISLLMSAAIPNAFDANGLWFAASYVILQLVRSAFTVIVFRGEQMGRNFAHLLVWSAFAGVAWIAGGVVEGNARYVLWAIALLIDYSGPVHGFALPHWGQTPTRDWTLAGGHLAERNRLVLIVALGESILAVGATYSELHAGGTALIAFIVGFVGAVSLWWLYFVRDAAQAEEAISHASDPTSIARFAFAYAHAVMVFGVIVTAVADDLTIAHPHGERSAATTAVILGGPILYLLGNAIFNISITLRIPWSRVIGIGALALVIPLARSIDPLWLAATSTAIVLMLALVTGSPAPLPGLPRAARRTM